MTDFAMILNTPRNELSVTPLGDREVYWVTKKGDHKAITAEGAIYKGGQALAALRDVAAEVALSKAIKGRYKAAFDIIGAKFPGVQRAADKLIPAGAWGKKESFITKDE